MNILDLHGTEHDEADFIIERFVTDNFQELPVKIITGNSPFFIGKVNEVINKHKLFCYKEGYVNEGCWIVVKSPWF